VHAELFCFLIMTFVSWMHAGQKMDAVIGAVPKSTLAQTIEKYLE